MNTPQEVICFYHAECLDGWAAAMAVHAKHSDTRPVKLVPVKYNDEPTDYADKEVYVVDFSFDDRHLADLIHFSAILHMYDHHEHSRDQFTRAQSLKDLAITGTVDVIHDTTRSGALITWETLFPGAVPSWVRAVSDHDLWQFEYTNTAVITEGLLSNAMCISPFWLALTEEDARSDSDQYRALMREIETTGAAVINYRDTLIDFTIHSTATNVVINRQVIPIINTIRPLGSKTLEKLAFLHPYAIGWYVERDRYKLSFRSHRESPVDLNALLKPLGGGGHPTAAGLVIPINGRDIFTTIDETFHPKTRLQKLLSKLGISQ
jgi:oligoribonuclease NrnB/cAMP/cGMP phosphodiesterase (DHH superfamily)